MPHGIVLLATLKNNDNCYLLFEQPSSGHFYATPCVSSYLWFPSHDLLAFTKSTHCHLPPRSEGTNASSSSSSYLYSWCSPHNLCFVTKPHVCRLSSQIPQALILIILNSENFYFRNGVIATNIINTASAPHQRCQHPTKGALLLAPSKQTHNISSTSSYHRSSLPSHDFLSVTKPTHHKTSLEISQLAST